MCCVSSVMSLVINTVITLLQILSDTKELQKEINSLTGKLDRTFAVTDELVFKVSEGFFNKLL